MTAYYDKKNIRKPEMKVIFLTKYGRMWTSNDQRALGMTRRVKHFEMCCEDLKTCGYSVRYNRDPSKPINPSLIVLSHEDGTTYKEFDNCPCCGAKVVFLEHRLDSAGVYFDGGKRRATVHKEIEIEVKA